MNHLTFGKDNTKHHTNHIMNIIATVGRNSRIVRKARLAADLAVRMEENNRSDAANVAAHIAEMKSKGRPWHTAPRIQK